MPSDFVSQPYQASYLDQKTNLEKFVYVIPHIVIDEFWVEGPKVGVIDIFEYQRWCLALTIPHHVQQCNNIRPSGQILQYLDLPLYLLLLDGFENFDNAFLVVGDVDAFENLRVFPSSY